MNQPATIRKPVPFLRDLAPLLRKLADRLDGRVSCLRLEQELGGPPPQPLRHRQSRAAMNLAIDQNPGLVVPTNGAQRVSGNDF